jgi:hypothetical protein
MANYRSLHVKIWSDPVIENLPPNARYIFIYLITTPVRNESAMYDITLKRISNDTGLNLKQVKDSMDVLVREKRIMYDDSTCTVWVVNAVKHQSMNDNCMKSILTDLNKCSSKSIAYQFALYYNGFNGLETHADGFAVGLETHHTGTGITTGIEDKKEQKGKEEKERHGEFKNVLLYAEEFQKLIEKEGTDRTAAAIEILSTYMESKGKKYKSHYATLLSWAFKSLDEKQAKAKPKFKSDRETIEATYDETMRRYGGKK